MSDVRSEARANILQLASDYRDRLRAELEKVEEFLAIACELTSHGAPGELEPWLCEDSDVPAMLH